MTGVLKKAAMLLLAASFFGCAGSSGQLSLHTSPYMPLETLQPGSILHVPTGTLVSRDALMRYLETPRVVYVGESHTNISHHRVQLDIIKTLFERRPGRIAVGMEMFSRSSQAEIDRWMKGELDDRAFFRLWTDNWGFGYEYYKEILEFVRSNRIPLIGLNISRAEASAVIRGDREKGLPMPELDEKDQYHRAMVKSVFSDPSHGTMNDFDGFYRAQLLWEETMAETVAAYLGDPANKDKSMVVLSGGGHVAYGFGIPKRVFRRLGEPYAVVLPVSPDVMDMKTAKRMGVRMLKDDAPEVPFHAADFAWATAYESLEGKEAKLGVALVDEAGVVKVSGVAPRSNAQRAGVREGDVIQGIDGLPVKDRYDVPYYLGRKRAHEAVILTIERQGVKRDVTVIFEPYYSD